MRWKTREPVLSTAPKHEITPTKTVKAARNREISMSIPQFCTVVSTLTWAMHTGVGLVFTACHTTAYPSVCPSHSGLVSKRANAERCGLHRPVADVYSFLVPRTVDGRWPCPAKIWVQRGRLPAKTGSRAVHISPHHCVSKKVPTLKLSVTLSNLNRFSKLLHCWKAYEICYKLI